MTRARDRAEAELLSAFSEDEQRLLRALLTRLAADQAGGCLARRRIVHLTRSRPVMTAGWAWRKVGVPAQEGVQSGGAYGAAAR